MINVQSNSDEDITMVYRVLKRLLLKIEEQETENIENILHCHHEDTEESTWLLGFTPAENRHLNWILSNYDDSADVKLEIH